MKILHVLANSSPDVNGYAVRTQMLLQFQNQMEEIENLGLTSPWYPDRESMVTEHSMNSVRYLRTVHPSRKKNSKISHKLVHFFTRKPVLDKANTTKSVKKKIIMLGLLLHLKLSMQLPLVFMLMFHQDMIMKILLSN